MDSGGDDHLLDVDEWPQPPEYSFSPQATVPRIVVEVKASQFDPPCSYSSSQSAGTNPRQKFWRRARWSPDGSHLLAQTEAHELDLFAFTTEPPLLQHVFRIASPTTILDYIWYPYARFDNPTTWCFFYSAPGIPIKLVDAYYGSVRATYGIENHIEQFIGPHALGVSTDGSSLYCGAHTSLACFAVTKPGTNTGSLLPMLPTKRAKGVTLQRGLVSAMAVGRTYAPSASISADILAVGTFLGTIGIYQRPGEAAPGQWTATAKQPILAHELCIAGWSEDGNTGIIQLLFHPSTPYLLFVSLRQSPLIKCYDLRYISSIPNFTQPSSSTTVVALFRRSGVDAETSMNGHQRLFIDVDWAGRWLVVGDHRGCLRVWSLTEDGEGDLQRSGVQKSKAPLPHFEVDLHRDSICSVALHPLSPFLVSSSGSRHWSGCQTQGCDDEGGRADGLSISPTPSMSPATPACASSKTRVSADDSRSASIATSIRPCSSSSLTDASEGDGDESAFESRSSERVEQRQQWRSMSAADSKSLWSTKDARLVVWDLS